GLCLWICFLPSGLTVIWKDGISIGQSGISRSVGRIFVDRLIKVVDRCLESIACPLVPEVSSFKVKLGCFRAFRRFGGDNLLFPPGEFRPQLVSDGFGHLSLN